MWLALVVFTSGIVDEWLAGLLVVVLVLLVLFVGVGVERVVAGGWVGRDTLLGPEGSGSGSGAGRFSAFGWGVVGGGAGCGVLCASFVLCLRWWVWGVGGCVLCDLNSGREHLVMHLWLVDLSAWGVLPRGWWVGWLL